MCLWVGEYLGPLIVWDHTSDEVIMRRWTLDLHLGTLIRHRGRDPECLIVSKSTLSCFGGDSISRQASGVHIIPLHRQRTWWLFLKQKDNGVRQDALGLRNSACY